MKILILLSFLIGCKKKNEVKTNNSQLEQEEIIPATVESNLRLVEVLPNVVEVGVRSDATVMGTGFSEDSQLYIDDQVSPLENVVFQDSGFLEISIPALSKGTHNLRIENPNGESHTLYAAIEAEEGSALADYQELSEKCAEMLVYFSSANFKLDETAQSLLDENISCFTNQFMYAIEGHCDERGTTEYNISLGQKRAEIIQQYLLSKGIVLDRIQTISYGEERPVAAGTGEDSWSKNRRAVIKIND